MTLKLHNLKTGMCHFGTFYLLPPQYPFDRDRCPDSQLPLLLPLDSVAFRENTEQIYSGLADTQKYLGITEALLLIQLSEIGAKGQKWMLFI